MMPARAPHRSTPGAGFTLRMYATRRDSHWSPPASPSRNAGCPWSRTGCASGARPGRESDRQPHLYVVSLTCAKRPRSRTTAAVIDDACGGELARSDKPIPVGGRRAAAGNDEEGCWPIYGAGTSARALECGGPTVGGGVRAHAGSAGDGRVLLLSDCVHNAGPRSQLAVRRIS